MILDRRALLTGLAATVLTPVSAYADTKVADFELPLPDGRSLTVFSRVPAAPKGGVLFSHGAGSWPARYETLTAFWLAQGYALLAPMHADSLHVPEDKRKSLQEVFPLRIADMVAVATYAREAYAGLPQIAAGHSYGSLFSAMLGGALEYVAPVRMPEVKAVVCYSSPGAIPGLINPQAYKTLKVPVLVVTGDQDVVPGFVTDWRDHLLPFEGTTVPDSHALIIKDGHHDLIGGADPTHFALATDITRQFLSRTVLKDNGTVALPAGVAAELKSK